MSIPPLPEPKTVEKSKVLSSEFSLLTNCPLLG